jgi:hypothetical protein
MKSRAIWATVDESLEVILRRSSKLKRIMHRCCRFSPVKFKTSKSKVGSKRRRSSYVKVQRTLAWLGLILPHLDV